MEELKFIAEALESHPSIEHWISKQNNIGKAGAEALAELLLENPKIRKLNVRNNKNRPMMVQIAVVEAIRKIPNVIDVNLNKNNIGDQRG